MQYKNIKNCSEKIPYEAELFFCELNISIIVKKKITNIEFYLL